MQHIDISKTIDCFSRKGLLATIPMLSPQTPLFKWTGKLFWASGQAVKALDCCAKHLWFEPNTRIIVGMLAHCSPSSKWVPGGNTGEVKGGEERNWPPYLTMPMAQDKCHSNGHPPPTYGIVHGTHLYLLSSSMIGPIQLGLKAL